MTKSKTFVRTLFSVLASLLCVVLIAAACGGDEDDGGTGTTQPSGTTAVEPPPDDGDEPGVDMAHLGDGSLGVVAVEAGDAIQIRSLNAITGDVAFFGLPIERAVVLAVEDYGQIKGFDVDLGTTLDDLCSNDGGRPRRRPSWPTRT